MRSGFCEGLFGDIPVAYSLPDTVLCQRGYCIHDPINMESSEDLKLYEQPLPTAGEEVCCIDPGGLTHLEGLKAIGGGGETSVAGCI